MDLLDSGVATLDYGIERISTFSFQEQYSYFNNLVGHNLYKNNNLNKLEKDLFIKSNEKLDKYYTKKSVANFCYSQFKKLLLESNKNLNDLLFIEPSAGSGVFLESIEEAKVGFDIAPTTSQIIKNDFLNENLLELLNEEELKKQLVFIGNPPFGTKSKLAIEFINKSLEYSNVVGFIVPVQFRKWSVQSRVNKNARLLLDIDLQENAFEFMGKDYKVRCCFQVWALDSLTTQYSDLRIAGKPDTTHPDFEMYQYNRTEEAKKFFDYEWDFAVPRQGYSDYSIKYFDKADCNKKQQWIFFKARNKRILKKLMNIDFSKLSLKNITTPGFGKADVIEEYIKIYG